MFYLDRFPPPPTDGGTESLSADSGWKPKYDRFDVNNARGKFGNFANCQKNSKLVAMASSIRRPEHQAPPEVVIIPQKICIKFIILFISIYFSFTTPMRLRSTLPSK